MGRRKPYFFNTYTFPFSSDKPSLDEGFSLQSIDNTYSLDIPGIH